MKVRKNKVKIPVGARRNPELDKYEGVVLFPEKLKKANDILKNVGLPKI